MLQRGSWLPRMSQLFMNKVKNYVKNVTQKNRIVATTKKPEKNVMLRNVFVTSKCLSQKYTNHEKIAIITSPFNPYIRYFYLGEVEGRAKSYGKLTLANMLLLAEYDMLHLAAKLGGFLITDVKLKVEGNTLHSRQAKISGKVFGVLSNPVRRLSFTEH
jgi:hypothetical protein